MSTYETARRTRSPQRALAEHESHHPTGEHHADVGAAPPVKPASTKRIVAIVTGVAVVLAALLVSSFLPRRATTRELEAEVADQEWAAGGADGASRAGGDGRRSHAAGHDSAAA